MQPRDKPGSPTRRAAIITGIYVAVSLVWIGISDWLLAAMGYGDLDVAVVQTAKGTFFVGVTGLMLFLLVRSAGEHLVRSHTEALRAARDELTGLPGWHALKQVLDQMIARASERGESLAVIVLGIKELRRINQAFGTAAGDAVVIQVAQRLQEARSQQLVLARPGTGYFVVAVPSPCDEEQALRLAVELDELLQAPFEVAGNPVHVGVTAGVALYPEDATTCERLIRAAELAMARAREHNWEVARYERGAAHLQRHISLENDLRRALEHDQYRLHFQPIVNLRSGRIVGAESLLRWQHPKHGLMPPGDFIPLLERSGAIVEAGAWVLDAACRQAAAWHQAGHAPFYISVNVSRLQLSDPEFVTQVRRALVRSGLPADSLVLEVTESLAMRDPAETQARLTQLHEAGVGLAMDDFGTGYSSLAYLKRYPLNLIKIDRLFVQGIPHDRENDLLIQTILDMTARLERKVIAEGVEESAELERLAELGCDAAQGFLFSRPVPAPDFERLLAKPLLVQRPRS